MDATTMEYSHEFDAVIDKGTFDALNCGDFEVVENLIMKMEYPLTSRHLVCVCFLHCSDALKDGALIIISQLSGEDQMQEFLSSVWIMAGGVLCRLWFFSTGSTSSTMPLYFVFAAVCYL